MKKHIILVLLVAFAALANSMQAQEDGNYLKREIDSLKTVIQKQNKEIKDKEWRLEGKALQKQINSHERNIQKYQSNIVKYQNDIDSIKGLLTKKHWLCDSLEKVNATLEHYKTQVNPLVKRQLSQMATTIDNTWLGKTYAETDMANLSEELKLYKDFKEQDKGVEAAYKKLVAFSEDVLLFKQGVEIVNSPYDANQIAAIIQPFENLVNKEKHVGRKAEASAVFKQLQDYSECLRCFQKDIIDEVDGLLESYKRDGTSKKAWKQVKSFLESADGNANVKKLSKIPWLEKEYILYVKQLEKDPYAPNPARNAIMELQP